MPKILYIAKHQEDDGFWERLWTVWVFTMVSFIFWLQKNEICKASFSPHFSICKCSCNFLEIILFLQATINQSPISGLNATSWQNIKTKRRSRRLGFIPLQKTVCYRMHLHKNINWVWVIFLQLLKQHSRPDFGFSYNSNTGPEIPNSQEVIPS